MENFYFNLKTLAKKVGQKQLLEKTEVSSSTLTNYLGGKSQPSLAFLLQLKKHYNINLDAFLTTKIAETATQNANTTNKFAGNYIVYYYNSSPYKGKVGSYNHEDLTYGVISVLDGCTTCLGTFTTKRDVAEDYLKQLNSLKNNADVEQFYSNHEDSYCGGVQINSTQIFLSLKNSNDTSLVILNNPPSIKKYIGGLGTVNSISRGREHVPCIQYVLLSKNKLKIVDGEIHNLLSLGIVEVNIKKETEELVELFKNLYLNKTSNILSEYQQKKILEDSIQNIVEVCVEKNMFRFAKVSNIEDDTYFRKIKDEMYE